MLYPAELRARDDWLEGRGAIVVGRSAPRAPFYPNRAPLLQPLAAFDVGTREAAAHPRQDLVADRASRGRNLIEAHNRADQLD
jgi:hypothetical protein